MTKMKVATEHSEQAQHHKRKTKNSGLRVLVQEPIINFIKDPSSALLLLPNMIKPETTIQKK
jgi:hypothetical protein